MKTTFTRRQFLISCLMGGTGFALARQADPSNLFTAAGANNRVRVGIVGLGENGLRHLQNYLRIADVEICALCDTDQARLDAAAAMLSKAGSRPVVLSADFRRLTDLKDLDAVSIAVPRAKRATIAADFCRAGKGVMLEQPFSQNSEEGKTLIAAVKKGGVIAQQKDDNYIFTHDDLYDASAFHFIGGIQHVRGQKTITTGISGVASRAPKDISARLAKAAWSELDMARCVLSSEVPAEVSSMNFTGGGFLQERTALNFDFCHGGIRSISFEIAGLPGREATEEASMEFFGTHGKMKVTYQALTSQTAEAISVQNFIDCVRDNDATKLLNPLAEAQKSNLLIELATLSIAHNQIVAFDPVKE
jgi:hypothetical protein